MPSKPLSEKIGRGFDRLAPVYDGIVELTFGRSIELLQQETLSSLERKERVAIIGGGSGLILKQALDFRLGNAFTNAEWSEAMVNKTKERLSPEQMSSVQFTKNAFRSEGAQYDYILFPFVLDCYTEDGVIELLERAKKHLSPNGKVVVIDFNQEAGTGYQKSWIKEAFIQVLYFFFRMTTSIPGRALPPFHSLAKQTGLHLETAIYRSNGWLQGTVWIMEARV